MASIPNGILGNFVGTAGNVCGYMRNGKNFVRSRRRKSTSPMTGARLAQQQKLKVCNEFTKLFCGTGFFNKTFPAYGHSGTGFNRVTSAIMNLAITGNYPDFSLNYSKVLISKGPLPPPENAMVAKETDGKLLFTWENNSNEGSAQKEDKVILVAFFPGLKQVMYTIGDAVRNDGEAILDIGVMKDFAAEIWIGFLSADKKNASCSSYCP